VNVGGNEGTFTQVLFIFLVKMEENVRINSVPQNTNGQLFG